VGLNRESKTEKIEVTDGANRRAVDPPDHVVLVLFTRHWQVTQVRAPNQVKQLVS
jgi:hypothetical protein